MDEKLPLMDEQRPWFLEMQSAGEDAVKNVEMTKDLEYYNIVDKVEAEIQMLSNSITYHKGIVHEKKSRSIWQTSLLSYVKKLSQLPQPSATTTLIIPQPSKLRQVKDCYSLKAQMLVSIFSSIVFFNYIFLRHNAIVYLVDYSVV